MPTSGKNKKPFQTLLGILTIALSILGLSTPSTAFAQTNTTTPTTIVVSDTVKTTNAKRFGVNLGTQNYYDTGMMVRNLAFNNPGFEGESWQTILHCKTVTANSCTDDNPYNYWPANFVAGASAAFIVGPAAGTTATVTSSTAPVPGVTPITIQMSGLSVAPSVGDYIVVRMEVPGNAVAGWWPQQYGGATYGTETTDLSPNTPGKQALVINASGAGQYVVLANYDDGADGRNFLELNGAYTITFRAKCTSGATNMHINVRRLATPTAVNFLDQDVTLTNQWKDYSFTYQLSETAPNVGPIELSFEYGGGSMLLDDVSFGEVAAANNPTTFRNAVVSTLQALHPGTIRYQDQNNWGSSIDNLLVPDFARERAGYAVTSSEQGVIAIGLHDFLVLCQTVGADPWFTMPTGMTTQEMSNLMDYLGGSASTVYGAKRAALGQTAPWTTVFGQIHLEFGNEVWNTLNAGALIPDAASYGKRAGVIFTAAKASPSYSAKSFDFVLDGFWALPNWSQEALQNSENYDTVDVASYNFSNFADASSTENIYGPMFAEPEWYNSTSSGNTAQNAVMAATAGPTPAHLAVYETNISTNGGTATQAQVNAVVPSLGAGLSVAANMLLAQRDLGVTVQNMYSLSGFQNTFNGSGSAPAATTPVWGVTVDMGGATNLRRPNFLAVALANSAILPTLLATSQSGANPTWNQPFTANDNFSLSGAHYIQSFAYTDGTTLNVILLNLSRTSALPVNFAGLNAPVGTATVKTLTAASINANNENAENVAIATTSQSFSGGSTLTLPPFSMTVVSVPAPVIPVLVTGVTASCARTSLSPNDSTTCSAAVAGQGANYNTSVVWSAAAGSISSSGAYTAPATVPASGKDVITATSAGDATKSSSVTIALAPNVITGVTASCASTNISQGATVQCTAKVAGTGSFSNAFTWSAPGGSFSPTGAFTAPGTGSSVVVTATSTQDPTQSASVTLNLATALVISGATATTTGTTATVSWTTNMPSYGGINYGTSLQSSASTGNNNLVTTHSYTLTGLQPSTTYYMYVLSYVGSQSVSQVVTATTTNGTSSVSGVSVSCPSVTLLFGASTGCAATVQGSGASSAVTWSTSLGTISPTGVITAPSTTTATSLTVTATSVQDATKSGSVTIALSAPPAVTGVTVACQATTILAGSSTTCLPTVTGTGSISKAVTFAASAGAITPTGVLTAPTTGNSVLVTATSVQDSTKSATATITLTPLPTITGVSVSCQAVSIVNGSNTTCSPTLTGTGNYSSAVTWSASSGSITPTGSFTAPASGTAATITATSTQDPTKSASVTLTLIPALTNSAITTSVTSTTVTVNWTSSIDAYNGINYGTTPQSTGATGNSYKGTNHSVTVTGLLPATTYYLYVISYEGAQTVGTPITVTTAAATPAVTGIAVNCPGTMVAGSSGVCAATVTGTGSYSSAVTWSASAGAITPNGVLTAPTTGTSVTVKVTSVQDTTKSATATITVTPLPTISSVTVTCPASTLVAGSSTNCAASVAGTGSYSSAVTWSASGGSVTSAGLVTTSTTATAVTVQATSVQDPTKSATATIVLTQPVTVSSVKVYCPVSTLPFGKSITCLPTVVGTGNPSSAVTWSASTGTITSAGVVTAPQTGSKITVTATSVQDPTKSASWTMALVQNLAIINPTFSATPTTIVVSWNLTDYAYSGVSYNSGLGTPTATTPEATIAMTRPSFTLTGLLPGTTYNLTLTSGNKFATVTHQATVTTPLQ